MTKFSELESFNVDDPFEAEAERVRRKMIDALNADVIGMTPETAEAFLCGALTGLAGLMMCATRPNGHGALMKAFQKYMPHAFNNARSTLGLPEIETEH